MAFLVMLQRLTPAERAVLLLHDVYDLSHAEIASMLDKSEAACRKLLSRARENVAEERRALEASSEEHRGLLQAFLRANRSGEIEQIQSLLVEDATLTIDVGPGGRRVGRIRNVGRPVVGAHRIAAFLAAVSRQDTRKSDVQECTLNGAPAIVFLTDGRPSARCSSRWWKDESATFSFRRTPAGCGTSAICIDCHAPRAARSDRHEQGNRSNRRHGWPGFPVIEHLLGLVPASGVAVSVRHPQTATALEARGVRVRRGDFDDPATLDAAFEGADRVFVISTLSSNERRFVQQRNAIDAARRAGARTVLYTSVLQRRGSVFAATPGHVDTEDYLERSEGSFTIVRNAHYMENLPMFLGGAILSGDLALPPDGPTSWVARADLGEGIARLLVEDFEGRRTIASPARKRSTFSKSPRSPAARSGGRSHVAPWHPAST